MTMHCAPTTWRPTIDSLIVRARAQHGNAMLLAIVIIFVSAGLGGVVIATANDSSGSLTSQRSRSSAGAAADTAAMLYQSLLNARRVDESGGFWPTAADIDSVLGDDPGAGVAPLSEVPVVFRTYKPIPATPLLTARIKVLDDATSGRVTAYWQVIAIRPPDYVSSNAVTVWFRTWLGRSPSARAQYTRVEYRPGYFSDYQLMTNGPIVFTGPTSLGGRVHSNGHDNQPVNNPIRKSDRIWTQDGGSVSCSGSKVRMTVSKGTIQQSIPGNCNKSENRPPVNLMNTRFTLAQMATQCGTIGVTCYPTAKVYEVVLSANAVTVDGIWKPINAAHSFLFTGEVRVRGTTHRRVTIAAQSEPAQATLQRRLGGVIRIAGDVGSYDGTNDTLHASSVLGLLGQGDVIVDPDPPNCGGDNMLNIHAAIVSQTGGLTLDPQKATQNYQSGLFSCRRLNMKGSIAANEAPLLVWKWNDGTTFGFAQRSYIHDVYGSADTEHLERNPPPYFPNDGRWQIVGLNDNNVDCLPGVTTTPAADGCGWG